MMEKLFQGEIMALSPQYVDEIGNCTMVYLKGSEPFIVERTIKSVIRILARKYMIDLNEVKRRYRPIVSSPNLVPIPFSKKDVFVPFKTRIPICKNDGALSYVNMRYIKAVKDIGEYRLVNLNNERTIKCLSSLSSMDNHIRNGNVVSRCYEENHMKVSEDEEYYNIIVPANMFKYIKPKN